MTSEQQAEAILINKLDITVGEMYWYLDETDCRQVIVDDIQHVRFSSQNPVGQIHEWDEITFRFYHGKSRWLKRDRWSSNQQDRATTFGSRLRAAYIKPKKKSLSIDVPHFGEV